MPTLQCNISYSQHPFGVTSQFSFPASWVSWSQRDHLPSGAIPVALLLASLIFLHKWTPFGVHVETHIPPSHPPQSPWGHPLTMRLHALQQTVYWHLLFWAHFPNPKFLVSSGNTLPHSREEIWSGDEPVNHSPHVSMVITLATTCSWHWCDVSSPDGPLHPVSWDFLHRNRPL